MDSNSFNFRLHTLERQYLTEKYVKDGIFKNVVTMEVEDALRGEPEITSGQLSPENIEDLKLYLEDNNLMEELKRFFLLNSLYGGSALIIDILNQDTDKYLNINHLTTNDRVKFKAVDRWELSNNNYSNPLELKKQHYMGRLQLLWTEDKSR
jgi:hypothetical protein